MQPICRSEPCSRKSKFGFMQKVAMRVTIKGQALEPEMSRFRLLSVREQGSLLHRLLAQVVQVALHQLRPALRLSFAGLGFHGVRKLEQFGVKMVDGEL
jgi:hypothetical protein